MRAVANVETRTVIRVGRSLRICDFRFVILDFLLCDRTVIANLKSKIKNPKCWWSNHAKSKTSSFESPPRKTPGARCDARAANRAVPQLSGAAHAASRLPQ